MMKNLLIYSIRFPIYLQSCIKLILLNCFQNRQEMQEDIISLIQICNTSHQYYYTKLQPVILKVHRFVIHFTESIAYKQRKRVRTNVWTPFCSSCIKVYSAFVQSREGDFLHLLCTQTADEGDVPAPS